MTRFLRILLTVLFTFGFASLTSQARADAPSVIRIGYPGVGIGNRPASFGNAVATLHLRGLLEDEFKKDGIKVQWTFLRGAGPAVNELFANGLLDFSHLGDLPSVVGRASALKYKVLGSSGVRGNIYVSATADSAVKNLKELRGKKVAVQKGTSTHLAALKILESAGLITSDKRGQFVFYRLQSDNLANTLASFMQAVCPVSQGLKKESRTLAAKKKSQA